MLGIILAAAGTLFEEIANSFGKWEVEHKEENIYTFGFLNAFWILIVFIVLVIIRGNFVFNPSSIPLLALLVVLELAQTYSFLNAVVEAERSTLGFLMVGTIPLLLVVDMFLGYTISIYAVLGVSSIVLGILILFLNHGISKKGVGYVLFCMLNAVATISIFKYCITYYNSVEAQQIITVSFIVIFLFIMSMWRYKENPFNYLKQKKFFLFPLSNGVGGVMMALAYMYAPASIITGAKRAFALMWAMASGQEYFQEKHIAIKILSFLLIAFGLYLMVLVF